MVQVGDLVVGNFFHHGKIGLVVQIGNAPIKHWDKTKVLALVAFIGGVRAWEPRAGLRKIEN